MAEFRRNDLVQLKPSAVNYDRYKNTFPWKIIGAKNPGGNVHKIEYEVITITNVIFSDIPEEDLEKWR